MAFFPLARTPGDKKGVATMRSYSRRMESMLRQIAPWVTSKKPSSKRRKRRSLSRQSVNSGEVVVILDKNDSKDNPLYKGAEFRQG